MSWAKLAAKNASNIDNTICKDPSAKATPMTTTTTTAAAVQYGSTKWTNVYTPITFLLISEIVGVVKEFIPTGVADIVGEYAAFYFGLQWCNLQMCYQQKMDPRNSWYVSDWANRGNRLVNLVKRFGIDPIKHKYICGFTACQIILTRLSNKSDPVYDYSIIFANNHNDIRMQPRYTIQLNFHKSHIISLVKINTYEEFVALLEQIYKNEKLNRHTMEHKFKKQKLEQLWDIWTKIFGPKLVFDYLQGLTEF